MLKSVKQPMSFLLWGPELHTCLKRDLRVALLWGREGRSLACLGGCGPMVERVCSGAAFVLPWY